MNFLLSPPRCFHPHHIQHSRCVQHLHYDPHQHLDLTRLYDPRPRRIQHQQLIRDLLIARIQHHTQHSLYDPHPRYIHNQPIGSILHRTRRSVYVQHKHRIRHPHIARIQQLSRDHRWCSAINSSCVSHPQDHHVLRTVRHPRHIQHSRRLQHQSLAHRSQHSRYDPHLLHIQHPHFTRQPHQQPRQQPHPRPHHSKHAECTRDVWTTHATHNIRTTCTVVQLARSAPDFNMDLDFITKVVWRMWRSSERIKV